MPQRPNDHPPEDSSERRNGSGESASGAVEEQPCRHDYWPWAVVILLLSVHAGIVAYSATKHSPTLNEPGHLVAGLAHWKLGRFDIYRVNPPLSHVVAAIPVLIAGDNYEWEGYYDSPGARPEFRMGSEFIAANGERSMWLFTLARWACIPFSLLGGLVCFLWARELWNSVVAGLIAVWLWCFDPNVLAHAGLVTPDMAAAGMGMAACYLFWRWLRVPTWPRALPAGVVLGLAQLTKTSWLILFGLVPVMWGFWLITEWCRVRQSDADRNASTFFVKRTLLQLPVILALMLYVLNLGYGFIGSFTRLKDYDFVSTSLSGHGVAGEPGNRFRGTIFAELPVPVPKQYVRGVDLQKKDFESYQQKSFLLGEWKQGGWWHYYLYGLWVKTAHGTQLLFVLSLLTAFGMGLRSWRLKSQESQELTSECRFEMSSATLRDLSVLAIPPCTLFVLVSSQTEFNHHVRYVLPVYGFAFVFIGVMGTWFRHSSRKLS